MLAAAARSPGLSRTRSARASRPAGATTSVSPQWPAAQQAARAGSGARTCSCAAPGRTATPGSAPSPPGVMIAGHSAFATISPLCSRWPADPRRPQHPPQRLRLPPPPVAVGTPRSFRSVQIERSASPASNRPAHSRIDRRPPTARTVALVRLVPVRAGAAAGDLPGLGQLLVLAPDPAALVVALLLRHSPEDTSQELTVVRRRGQRHRCTDASFVTPAALQRSKNSSNSLRLPMQPVQVPDDNRVQETTPEVVQHPPVCGPRLAAPGAHIVIDVALRDLPALPRYQPLAILDLAVDAKIVSRPDRTRSERR